LVQSFFHFSLFHTGLRKTQFDSDFPSPSHIFQASFSPPLIVSTSPSGERRIRPSRWRRRICYLGGVTRSTPPAFFHFLRGCSRSPNINARMRWPIPSLSPRSLNDLGVYSVRPLSLPELESLTRHSLLNPFFVLSQYPPLFWTHDFRGLCSLPIWHGGEQRTRFSSPPFLLLFQRYEMFWRKSPLNAKTSAKRPLDYVFLPLTAHKVPFTEGTFSLPAQFPLT